MKKRTLSAIFAALTLGVCSLGMAACGGPSDTGSTSDGSSGGSSGEVDQTPVAVQVTEAEWEAFPFTADADSYMTGEDNYTLYAYAEQPGGGFALELEVDGTKCRIRSGEGEALDRLDALFEFKEYSAALQDMLGTSYEEVNGNWTADENGAITAQDFTLNAPANYLSTVVYDSFTYDAENKSYQSKPGFILAGMPAEAQVTFCSDGSVSLNATVSMGENQELLFNVMFYDIGTTEIVLPTVA